MIFIKEKGKGLLVCFGIAAAALLLGQWIHIIGGPVFAILIGMLLAFRIRKEEKPCRLALPSPPRKSCSMQSFYWGLA